jgi:dATP pyrophosphohydrolase
MSTGVGHAERQEKRPVSVLVLIHSPDRRILLLERSAHRGYWQSVTGSQESGESLVETARREVAEETGIDTARFRLTSWNQANRFEIFPEWRNRYPAGTSHNLEHVFSLEVPESEDIKIAPDEHSSSLWCSWQEAAEQVFSWTNRDAILTLARIADPR